MSAPNEEFQEAFNALMEKGLRSRSYDVKVRMFEDAARLADRHANLHEAWRARYELIGAATFGGHADKALVAFAWCRAQSTKDPQSFDGSRLPWRNKWMLEALAEFPHVTRKQLADAMEDFARSARERGASPRAELKLRCSVALKLGDDDDARRLMPQWVEARRDWNSDCAACDLDLQICAHTEWGDHERALELAEPLLSRRMQCVEVPHMTNGWLALAFFHLGRLEEARDVFIGGYGLVARNRGMLPTVGFFLALLGLTGNDSAALTLVEKHLLWALETPTPRRALVFHAAARFVFDRLARSHPEALVLRLPKAFPLHRKDGRYEAVALREWFDAEAARIAETYDRRNGNAHLTRWLEQSRGWHEQVRPIDISTGVL